MKKTISNGIIVLLITNLFAKFIGATFRIPLANLLGAEGIGLFQMVFPIYTVFFVYISSGIMITLSKKIAENRAMCNYAKIQKLIDFAFSFALFMGIGISFFLYYFGGTLAFLQGNIHAKNGYVAISFGFVFACLSAVFKGFFQGFENMIPSAFSAMIEQLSKLIFGLFFAFMLKNYGKESMVFGALLGVAFSEFISFLFLFFLFKKEKNSNCFLKSYICLYGEKNIKKIIKHEFLLSSIPISLFNIIGPVQSAVESLIVVNLLTLVGFSPSFSTKLFGVYSGMVLPIVNFPIIITSALTVAMLPKLSFNISKKISCNKIILQTYKFVWVIIIPCLFGIFFLAKECLLLLYPSLDEYLLQTSCNLFVVLSFFMLFSSINSISVCVLQANGICKYPLCVSLICAVLRFVIMIILIVFPQINILSIGVAISFSSGISAILNLFKLKKTENIFLKTKDVFLPIIFCFFMVGIILVLKNYLYLKNLSFLCVSISICMLFYFFCIIAFKVFTFSQIKQFLNLK